MGFPMFAFSECEEGKDVEFRCKLKETFRVGGFWGFHVYFLRELRLKRIRWVEFVTWPFIFLV